MKTRSAKNKGARLQKWIRDKLRVVFCPPLEFEDITSQVMGQSGEDVVLTPSAKKIIPYSFECKNWESWTSVYKCFAQAEGNSQGRTPVLIIKMNQKSPLAIVDAEWLLDNVIKPRI